MTTTKRTTKRAAAAAAAATADAAADGGGGDSGVAAAANKKAKKAPPPPPPAPPAPPAYDHELTVKFQRTLLYCSMGERAPPAADRNDDGAGDTRDDDIDGDDAAGDGAGAGGGGGGGGGVQPRWVSERRARKQHELAQLARHKTRLYALQRMAEGVLRDRGATRVKMDVWLPFADLGVDVAAASGGGGGMLQTHDPVPPTPLWAWATLLEQSCVAQLLSNTATGDYRNDYTDIDIGACLRQAETLVTVWHAMTQYGGCDTAEALNAPGSTRRGHAPLSLLRHCVRTKQERAVQLLLAQPNTRVLLSTCGGGSGSGGGSGTCHGAVVDGGRQDSARPSSLLHDLLHRRRDDDDGDADLIWRHVTSGAQYGGAAARALVANEWAYAEHGACLLLPPNDDGGGGAATTQTKAKTKAKVAAAAAAAAAAVLDPAVHGRRDVLPNPLDPRRLKQLYGGAGEGGDARGAWLAERMPPLWLNGVLAPRPDDEEVYCYGRDGEYNTADTARAAYHTPLMSAIAHVMPRTVTALLARVPDLDIGLTLARADADAAAALAAAKRDDDDDDDGGGGGGFGSDRQRAPWPFAASALALLDSDAGAVFRKRYPALSAELRLKAVQFGGAFKADAARVIRDTLLPPRGGWAHELVRVVLLYAALPV